jgi:hypothetical protein
LKLPSCPERGALVNGSAVFEGRGRGHGEGLDLEWAKRSSLDAGEILSRSYGARARSKDAPPVSR